MGNQPNQILQSTLPKRVETGGSLMAKLTVTTSIHSTQTGRDPDTFKFCFDGLLQSTLPKRVETGIVDAVDRFEETSIHSTQTGRDLH